MTRLLTLALLAVAASATLASAQTPVFEVRDAAGATLLFAINDDGTATCTNCVVTDALADGAVTPEKVAGGLFNGLTRGQLYERSAAKAVAGVGSLATATVACDATEDIPITGSCFTNNSTEATLHRFGPVSWESTTGPAIYSCVYKSQTTASITIQSRITCLDVTPDTPTLAPDLAPSPEQ